MGGAISNIYVDIASLPPPAEKARGKAPPQPSPGPIPAADPAAGAVAAAAPAEPAEWADQNGQRTVARPRRRSDGNGAAPSERKGLLAVHAVEKSFVGRKVVKSVSLYVRKGEAVGLLGPNGAGKTTVFYMITGLIKADQGRIELDGADVTRLPMYQRARLGIGYLPQEASIFRGLSVEDNIRAVLEVVEPDPRRRQQDLDSLLEEFNIARLRKTPAIALSGGERRRVEIARSLATRPNYMLLDEPFAGIDPIAVGDIQALVRHLTNRGIGVLITDHNVRETLGPHRPRLHHLFRRSADGGPRRRHRQQPRGAAALSGRGVPALSLPRLSRGENGLTTGRANCCTRRKKQESDQFSPHPWRLRKDSRSGRAKRW